MKRGFLKSLSLLVLFCAALLPGAEEASPAADAIMTLDLSAAGKPKNWENRKVGRITFYHGGLIRKDGRNLLITDSSGQQPFAVMQNGPGDSIRLTFRYADPGSLKFHILPKSKTLSQNDWKPDAGLVLTTWNLPADGQASRWQPMQKMLQKLRKTEPIGRDFVPNVYHGYHPFSNEDKFVSAYEGWIGLPADGEYIFATSSDDASFLLIDGKMIVQWPGQHGAVWDTRHQKKVTLTKGIHRFSYYHVNFGGPTIMCAAWKFPGFDKIIPISEQSFAPISDFTIQKAVDHKSSVQMMRIDNSGECWIEEKQLLRFIFSLYDFNDKNIAWDLGDGCSVTGSRVEHVYLTPGLRTITASLNGKTIAQNQIRIEPIYSRQTKRVLDDPEKYINLISSYHFDKMKSEDIKIAANVLTSSKKFAAAAKAYRVLMTDSAGKLPFAEAALALGKLLREELGKPEEAVKVYRQALQRKDLYRHSIAELIRQTGDTLFYYMKDLDGALNEYDKVVGRYADALEANVVRVTKIKIGDIYRQRVMGEKARKAYTDAEELLLYKRTFSQNTVRKGALYKMIDDFTGRKKLEEAQKWLEILEWEYPLEKLDGYSSIMRAAIAEKQKNLPEAQKQLLHFVAASPRSSYAAEALYRCAVLFKKSGKVGEVQRILQRLKKEYADSPYTEKANQELGRK